jgi:hypothetical protein
MVEVEARDSFATFANSDPVVSLDFPGKQDDWCHFSKLGLIE